MFAPQPRLNAAPWRGANQYSLATIGKWLEVFLKRFFEFSQFKRSRLAERAQGWIKGFFVAAQRLSCAKRRQG